MELEGAKFIGLGFWALLLPVLTWLSAQNSNAYKILSVKILSIGPLQAFKKIGPGLM